MTNSRNKGSAFERDIAKELFLLTGVSFKRDLEQYRAADHGDLIPDNDAWPFSLELKRYATGTSCKPEWRAQSVKAALATNRIPAVVFKFDRREIRVSLPLAAVAKAFGGSDESGEWAEVSLPGLAYLAAEIMAISSNSSTGRGESPKGPLLPRRTRAATCHAPETEKSSQGAKL